MPETPRSEQGKKPTQGGLGNIDEERGSPGKGDSQTTVREKENPSKRDNERQEPGVEEKRG